MRAVIYLRQSKDQHLTGLAVDRQRVDCEKLAAERGWDVMMPPLVDNDVSASGKVPRPAYEELLRLVDARAVDVIIAWHIDRLTRRLADLEDIIERCERARVRVGTVSGDLDLSTDSGRLVGRILASVARGEVERKSARQAAAGRQAANSGRPPARRAFGYVPGGMELDPHEAGAVRDAYVRLLAGTSLVALTTRLNAAGHVTTTGRPWERSGVRTMLCNPRNAGIRRYQGQEVGDGTWPAIVPEQTWRAAVALMDDPARKQSVGGNVRKWLGSGLYLCGRCGATMRVAYRREGARSYVCTRSKHLDRKADSIDANVELNISALLADPAVANALCAETPDVAEARDEQLALSRRLDSIGTDVGLGNLTGRQAKIATEVVEARLIAVRKEIAAAGSTSALAVVAGSVDPSTSWLTEDPGVRRAVLAKLCDVVILPGRIGRTKGDVFDPYSIRIVWR